MGNNLHDLDFVLIKIDIRRSDQAPRGSVVGAAESVFDQFLHQYTRSIRKLK